MLRPNIASKRLCILGGWSGILAVVLLIIEGRAGKLMEALEEAVLQSAQNLRGFDDDLSVVIACDVSSSRTNRICFFGIL